MNLWIGNSDSVTSIHCGEFCYHTPRSDRPADPCYADPYENIYTVVRGAKHFTLLPPTEGWCLKGDIFDIASFSFCHLHLVERKYPHAVYTRPSPTSGLKLEPTSRDSVRWSSISDPDLTGVSPEAHPIHVTLQAGDTLYLPVGWWHHVRQSAGVTIALNWWYDAEMRGMSWILLSFLRGIGEVPPGNEGESD